MKLPEIKSAIASGLTVHWSNLAYEVRHNEKTGYYIICTQNDSIIGLTHQDGVTLNGKEEQFFTGLSVTNNFRPDFTTDMSLMTDPAPRIAPDIHTPIIWNTDTGLIIWKGDLTCDGERALWDAEAKIEEFKS